MRRTVSVMGILLGGLLLSGCTTSEIRQEKPAASPLDFSEMEKEATSTELAKKETKEADKQQEKRPTADQPITSKKMYTYQPVMSLDTTKEYTATVQTSMGDIEVALRAKETPTTVNNFVFLAREKFYDGTIFHRTIKDFMIQGGDPTGTGMGGPGYKFADEPFEGTYTRGTLAMANAGPNTNGSQFFIMHKDVPLPPNYVIFGQVMKGLEVVDAIAEAPTKAGGEGSSPVTPVVVQSVVINEK